MRARRTGGNQNYGLRGQWNPGFRDMEMPLHEVELHRLVIVTNDLQVHGAVDGEMEKPTGRMALNPPSAWTESENSSMTSPDGANASRDRGTTGISMRRLIRFSLPPFSYTQIAS